MIAQRRGLHSWLIWLWGAGVMYLLFQPHFLQNFIYRAWRPAKPRTGMSNFNKFASIQLFPGTSCTVASICETFLLVFLTAFFFLFVSADVSFSFKFHCRARFQSHCFTPSHGTTNCCCFSWTGGSFLVSINWDFWYQIKSCGLGDVLLWNLLLLHRVPRSLLQLSQLTSQLRTSVEVETMADSDCSRSPLPLFPCFPRWCGPYGLSMAQQSGPYRP